MIRGFTLVNYDDDGLTSILGAKVYILNCDAFTSWALVWFCDFFKTQIITLGCDKIHLINTTFPGRKTNKTFNNGLAQLLLNKRSLHFGRLHQIYWRYFWDRFEYLRSLSLLFSSKVNFLCFHFLFCFKK